MQNIRISVIFIEILLRKPVFAFRISRPDRPRPGAKSQLSSKSASKMNETLEADFSCEVRDGIGRISTGE
jgi:hypothetical protein